MNYDESGIYVYRTDSDTYRCLESEEIGSMMSAPDSSAFYPNSGFLDEVWGNSRELQIYQRRKRKEVIPDFHSFDSSLPIISDHVMRVIAPLLSSSIIQMKSTCKGESLIALEVPFTDNSLDIGNSEFEELFDDIPFCVTKGLFYRDRVEGEMFRITECIDMYVTGVFLNAIEQNKLTGLLHPLKQVGRFVGAKHASTVLSSALTVQEPSASAQKKGTKNVDNATQTYQMNSVPAWYLAAAKLAETRLRQANAEDSELLVDLDKIQELNILVRQGVIGETMVWQEQLLAVGSDGCGNFVAIVPDSSYRGVLFIDHENEEVDAIAGTVNDYVDWLVELNDE